MYLMFDVFCWLVDLVWQVARARRLAGFARRQGFQPGSFGPLLDSGFDLLGFGNGRAIHHGFHGMWSGLSISVADYWWRFAAPGMAGAGSRHWYAIAVADVDLEMPKLKLEQENLFFRTEKRLDHLRAVPGQIVDVELGDARFDETFRVVCHDREFALDLLDGDMRQWLLHDGDGYEFELLGSRILISSPLRWGRLASPEDLLQALAGFCERLPAKAQTD